MRWTAGFSFLAALTIAPRCFAGDSAAAEALFLQARDAMKLGDYARACPMLEESYRLNEGTGTRFNLADCYEHVGKTASAWAAFRDVAAASRLAGHRDREVLATARANQLEPKLCRMKIDALDSKTPGLTVFRDQASVGAGQFGTEVPIDPGSHLVSAKAPNRAAWEKAVDVAGCPKSVAVEIPKLEVQVAPGTPPKSPPITGEKPPPDHSSARTVHTALGLGSFGLAAVGIGLGTYLGLHAASLRDESNAGHCQANTCDDEGKRLRQDSLASGDLATVSFVGAGVFAAAGIVLFLTMPAAQRETARARPGFTPTASGFRCDF